MNEKQISKLIKEIIRDNSKDPNPKMRVGSNRNAKVIDPRRSFSVKKNQNNQRTYNQWRIQGNRRNNRFQNRYNNQQNVIKVNKPKNVMMRTLNRNNKNTVISGKDLIIPCKTELINENSHIYAMIPINPLYWQDTRIKNLAIQNQYYTPESLSIEYVPTVSKFQKGMITIGCISNPFINNQSIENTLIASTSGESFSCSEFFRKKIALNSLLQQKKLLLDNKVTKESIPFFIVIYLSEIIDDGNLIAPGSFYINYSIKFFNPIANPLYFKTEMSLPIGELDLRQQNISGVLLEENNKYGPGTIFDVEKLDGSFNIIINSSKVTLDEDKKATFFYSSLPDQIGCNYDVVDLTGYTKASHAGGFDIQQNYYALVIDVEQKIITIYGNRNSDPLNIVYNKGDYYIFGLDVIGRIHNAAIYIDSVKMVPFTEITGSFPDTTIFENL